MSKDKLYIYLVGPVICGYDQFDSFVVTAATPKQARQFAHDNCFDDQDGVFLKADVKNLGVANSKLQPGVYLSSFNAG